MHGRSVVGGGDDSRLRSGVGVALRVRVRSALRIRRSPRAARLRRAAPRGAGAEALGLPADRLEGSRDAAVRTSSELIRAAAEENGGLLTCSWFEKDGPASIVASVAADAGDAFAALPAGPALAAGDAASGACTEGSCTAQVLAGSTWVSLAVTGAPATLDLASLASSTADSAAGQLDDVVAGTAPVCAELLAPEQLTSLAGLAQPVAGAARRVRHRRPRGPRPLRARVSPRAPGRTRPAPPTPG
ncbi:hypothetical protein [Rathayibacter sp. VKM Ac-2630]|uniref:hypothetical protein n=1 Tax=Rathayibacter sp. VKM Ac-2630 TaxID=1938617 RepID=UPI0009817A13|nr:hypothetical protein [Rathayibacter sp. VKM Ac-2630]OOB89954.1 hypothetical protein B0T42_14420 [Rathayibacter sp. VKM Ac-2630]